MNHSIIICPNLLPDRAIPEAVFLAQIKQIWPSFAALLSAGTRIWPTANTLEKCLFDVFDWPALGELPAAALSGLADGLSVHTGWWLRADPLHLQSDAHTAFMQDSAGLNLTMAEVTALYPELSAYFAEHQLTLHMPHPHRWYLSAEQPQALQTYTPGDVLQQSIVHFMPFGDQGAEFRHRFNDVQMLLHRHPVNMRRVEQGLAPVSGVWFWGSGVLPQFNQTTLTQLYASDALAQGLAQHCAVAFSASPRQLSEVFQECVQSPSQTGAQSAQRQLIEFSFAENQTPEQLEQTFFLPILKALQQKNTDKITLIINSHFAFEFEKQTLWTKLKTYWGQTWAKLSASAR